MTTQESTEKKRVSRTMTIEEILSLFPHKSQKLAHEITAAGLHCVGCHAATWETLEGGMLGHGMQEEAIDKLVYRLNALLDEESDESTISMTKKAAQKFLSILAEDGKEGWGLRFGEQMAGCSGYEYQLDYSEKAGPEDEVFESNGIDIHVEKKLLKRLLGCEIDYIDSLHNSGFKISNPNVKAGCGCGSSHNY